MRALIVDLSKGFGGACTRALALAGGLPRGTAALATLTGSPVQGQARSRSLEHYQVGAAKLDPRIGVRLARLARERQFGILDAQNPQSRLWTAVASLRQSFVTVSTLNSWYLDEWRGSLRGRAYQDLELALARGVDLFIAVSEEIRGRLRETGINDQRIALIENAVPLLPAEEPIDVAALRRDQGLPPDAVVCCAVGRLVEAKGYQHLIASMGRLAASEPRLHCLVVGTGQLEGALENALDDAGLRGRVHLLGYRPHQETLALMRAADLFVMPSVTEGTPLALLEAAAFGLPIVASRAGGIPDILTDGEHALLVDPGDPGALAQGVQRLLREPELAAALGTAAQRRIRARFDASAQAQRVLEAYERAAFNYRLRRRRTRHGR
jgi:glycosyltransferase involved in cell wall biosynthesis